jgi:hypothetical protein
MGEGKQHYTKKKKQWIKMNNKISNEGEKQVKESYTEIVNRYMEEYCNSLVGVNRIFSISLNLGIGSALTS